VAKVKKVAKMSRGIVSGLDGCMVEQLQ